EYDVGDGAEQHRDQDAVNASAPESAPHADEHATRHAANPAHRADQRKRHLIAKATCRPIRREVELDHERRDDPAGAAREVRERKGGEQPQQRAAVPNIEKTRANIAPNADLELAANANIAAPG